MNNTTTTSHAGDCTIYSSLINETPLDGICTCGYGFECARDGDWDKMFSAAWLEANKNSEKSNLPIPQTLYSCYFCKEDYSWPAEDLFWSELVKEWVCDMCWDHEGHGVPGPRLSEVIKAKSGLCKK